MYPLIYIDENDSVQVILDTIVDVQILEDDYLIKMFYGTQFKLSKKCKFCKVSDVWTGRIDEVSVTEVINVCKSRQRKAS